ncbi:hypothetical protein Pfo_024271 [Paulownia fortunei]|nr:hypothetical protein Pfo_024271 [Paulownia fortunei]
MGSSSLKSPLSPFPSSIFTKPLIPNPTKSNFPCIKLNPTKINSKKPPILRCIFRTPPRKPNSEKNSLSCLTINGPPMVQSSSVSERIQVMDFEFKSLPEPIDRVKRLLHCATLLPPFDESSRIQENRVMGCTTQVWLEVKMDQNGVLRFRMDSDSEITKGFCSCLIWLLDGAEADEVLSVKTEDLVEMNVGLPSRGNSRVNTWHNVLISMQKRTKDLVKERNRVEQQSLEALFLP